MNALAASGFAVAGATAGIPIAAIAYTVPACGSMRLPRRWWHGKPASPTTVTAVSAMTGVTAGLVARCLPLSPALPAFWLFAVLGVGLTIIDLRRQRLPHAMTGTLWVACTASMATESLVTGHARHLVEAASAGVAVTVLALVIALALPGQFGLGDVSLSGVIALSLGWLSWEAAAAGLVIGITTQAAAALIMLTCGASRRIRLPFGPALIAGWFVALCTAV